MFGKKYLGYRFKDDSLNNKEMAEELASEIIVQGRPTSSCWFSKLKTATKDFRTYPDFIKDRHKRMLQGEHVENTTGIATAKSCPGIISTISDSYLIKSPTDAMVTIDDKQQIVVDTSNSLMEVRSHGRDQFVNEGNDFFADKINLKFNIQMTIKTDGVGYMLLHPVYHSKPDFFVPHGVVSSKYAKCQELNIITLVDIPKPGETKSIEIKKGDVLAYLIPMEKIGLKFSEKDFCASKVSTSWRIKTNY